MPIVRTAAKTALGARVVVKDLVRLQQIAEVLARHGLGWIVANVEVPGVGLLHRFVTDPTVQTPTPERVAGVIRDLGPTFVKLGQMLSTRSDVIPAEYAAALVPLQDDVGAMTWAEVEREIVSALGKKPAELYKTFETEPLATASIAQVHRATLHTGEEVAVKVQRPGIRFQIETDLSILRFLARAVESQFPEAELVDAPGWLDEIARTIAEEIDFRVEAEHAEAIAKNFEGNPDVVIPKIYRSHTAATVLTLEFLDGVKIRDARERGFDLTKVGTTLMRADFQMLLEDGYFHGDLHPGNVLALPGNRVGLLDFGMVGRLTEEMRENIIALLFAINRRDFRTVARIYFELAIKREKVDYAAFEADVQTLFERSIAGRKIGELRIEDFVRELGRGALKHRVRLTPQYTMLFKALITAEGVAKQLLPEVDPLAEMLPYVERMADQLYSSERLQKELFYYLVSFRFAGRKLPVIASQLLGDLQDGRLRLKASIEPSPEETALVERRTNRAVASVLVAGLSVAGALALSSTSLTLFGVPVVAALCFAVAAGVLSWLLLRLWRGGL